jgi:hypothetical protein
MQSPLLLRLRAFAGKYSEFCAVVGFKEKSVRRRMSAFQNKAVVC